MASTVLLVAVAALLVALVMMLLLAALALPAVRGFRRLVRLRLLAAGAALAIAGV